MIMIRLCALFLLLGAAVVADAGVEPDAMFCGEAQGIYLPASKSTPAPNITLENFQVMSPDDACARNIDHEEVMRLHAGIKPIIAAELRDSPAALEVMVRYTLTPDKPAAFEMRVTDESLGESDRLSEFYLAAADLQEFHSTSGTVYVLFHYTIAPLAK